MFEQFPVRTVIKNGNRFAGSEGQCDIGVIGLSAVFAEPESIGFRIESELENIAGGDSRGGVLIAVEIILYRGENINVLFVMSEIEPDRKIVFAMPAEHIDG